MSSEARAAAGEFARTMVGHLSSAMLVTMLELGRRTGLLEALATEPLTAAELATRTRCDPRYVQEWLGAVVTGGAVVHDASADTFHLPPAHAASLVASSPYHLSGMVTIATGTAGAVDQLEEVLRHGGGIGYEHHPLDVDEAIVLGCAGMADLTDWLSRETGVPVIDGVTVAVKFVEGLAAVGLGTSKICAYAQPNQK